MSFIKQLLLSVVILAVAAGGWYFYGQPGQEAASGAASQGAGMGGRQGPGGSAGVPVITARVGTDTAGSQLRALGTLEAINAVTIYPEVTGIVTSVDVQAGAKVAKGDILLRLQDSDQTVAVERAEVNLENARDALARAEKLAQSRNITEVALTDARRATQTAEIDLKSAELERDKRHITAPFDGVVGLIPVSVGDLVGTSTVLTTLDDVSQLRVDFTAPERFVSLLSIGYPVLGTSVAAPGREIKGAVTAIDSRVDATTRLFKVESVLSEGIEGLKPGMSVTISIDFEGQPQATVPSLAIQWDRQGSYVWTLDGDTGHRTPVQILGRRTGIVMVVGDLKEGQEVVTEGLQRMREGVKVARLGDESAGTTGQAAASGADAVDLASERAENAPGAVQ